MRHTHSPMSGLRAAAIALTVGAACALGAPAAAENVLTYHGNIWRTGWNSHEYQLTQNSVQNGLNGMNFRRLHSVVLDEQSDAQPLIVRDQYIKNKGRHDVVYVATENNTLYAIDADTGDVLRKRNFGAAVPESSLPGGCDNNSQFMGIGSTPVIDKKASTMYLIADVYDSGTGPSYFLHAIDLSTLADVTPPVKVTASAALTNGHTYDFDAQVSRQRSALLLFKGNVYAGFASYCDVNADQSRGWLLGWNSGTLNPLAANELTNTRGTSPDTFFLTSIWMSGYGLAASDKTGLIYFVTGNSDPSGHSLNVTNNLAERAVAINSALTHVSSTFLAFGAMGLEAADADFGSGGLMLLPLQPGTPNLLAVAAGKDGTMYLLNGYNLHNHTSGTNSALGTYDIGGCWCGESYYEGGDGVGRVVSSGGDSVGIWKVHPGSPTTLSQVASSVDMGGVQSGGFFTSISSNGTKAGTAVIWAVSRPDGSAQEHLHLYAFDGKGNTLYSANAGTWPNLDGDSNTVPTVANGKVYVASYKVLQIFGFTDATADAPEPPVSAPTLARAPLPDGQHEVFGTVKAINGTNITVARRDGSLISVDMRPAIDNERFASPTVGHGVRLRGSLAGNAMTAQYVMHAKDNPVTWRPDR